jgi:ABC-type amino acid transport substrate-binding protein
MKRIFSLISIITAMALLLAGCKAESAKITSISDLEGKIIATQAVVMPEDEFKAMLTSMFGVTFGEILFFDNGGAAVAAVRSNKADAMLAGGPYLEYLTMRDSSFDALLTEIAENTFHFALRADDTEFRDEINALINAMLADGTLDELKEIYVTGLKPEMQLTGKVMPRFDGAPVYRIGLSGEVPPFDYAAADGSPAGFCAELLALLSEALEVNFEILIMPNESKFMALAAGTIDMFYNHAIGVDLETANRNLQERNITLTESYASFDTLGFLILK